MPSIVVKPSSLAATVMLVLLAACGGGGSDGSLSVGPCVVSYAEPSLFISSVQSSATASPVPVVTLSSITLDGSAFNFAFLAGVATNIRVVGTALECTVPCGLSTQSGTFAFTVAAPGYAASSVSASGAYSSSSGNCPALLSGGARVSVLLSPL